MSTWKYVMPIAITMLTMCIIIEGAHGAISSGAITNTAAAVAVLGNSDMGIQSYSFQVTVPQDVALHGISFRQAELRVYLRLYCTQGGITVKGFGGLFPSNANFPAAMYFYKQPAELQSQLKLSIAAVTAVNVSRSWPIWWRDTDSNKADMGLWPLDGPSGLKETSLSLRLKGSTLQHRLRIPTCSSTSNVGSSSSRTQLTSQQLEKDIAGIWNVVTTTDPNHIPPQKLSRLLLLHSQYHQRMGFQGTILRCNADEAHALAALPQLQAEIAAGRLLIWPWIWGPAGQTNSTGHPVIPQPYFWQVPRNQLVLLASYGRKVKLSFFDLDEYLVLPKGGMVQDAVCNGQRLLDDSVGVSTLIRYPALCTNCTGEELDCWETANQIGRPGKIQLTQCPCLLGKSVLTAGKVVNTKVHKSTPAIGYRGLQLDAHCAYLIHLQALISSKRPWDRPWDRQPRNDTILVGDWVALAHGSGVFTSRTEGQLLMNAMECAMSGQEVLRRCNQT